MEEYIASKTKLFSVVWDEKLKKIMWSIKIYKSIKDEKEIKLF